MSTEVIEAIQKLLAAKPQWPEPSRLLLVLSPKEWDDYGRLLTMSRDELEEAFRDESQHPQD